MVNTASGLRRRALLYSLVQPVIDCPFRGRPRMRTAPRRLRSAHSRRSDPSVWPSTTNHPAKIFIVLADVVPIEAAVASILCLMSSYILKFICALHRNLYFVVKLHRAVQEIEIGQPLGDLVINRFPTKGVANTDHYAEFLTQF